MSLDSVRTGQAVVVVERVPRLPTDPDTDQPETRLVIKRAAAVPGDPVPIGVAAVLEAPDILVPPGRLVLLGDNPTRSHDSRHTGYFTGEQVCAIVVRKMRS